jgi:ABC-type bacteriocin/lantibiotic exporter with double-glycine peptidase domain
MRPESKREAQWYFSLLRPFLRPHLISVGLTIIGSTLFLLDPLLLKWLIDRVLPKRDLTLLLGFVLAFLGIYVGRLTLSSSARLLSVRTVQSVTLHLRLAVLDRLNRLSARFHENAAVGDTLYRIEQDVEQIAEIGASLTPSVLQMVFNAVFVTTALCILNWRLAAVLAPLLPLFSLFRTYFANKLRAASDSAQQTASDETEFLQEHLSSVVHLQLLRQELQQTARFLSRATAKQEAANRRALAEVLFATCYMGLIALGTVGILGYGGYQVIAGTLTLGGLVAFYSYLGRLFDPLNMAVDIYARLSRLRSSIRRVLAITEKAPEVANAPHAVCLPVRAAGRIVMSGVHFSYADDNLHAIEDLNLEIKAGETIALVGASGSGKSTITKLIARLYDPTRGNIFLNDLDIRTIDLNSLRAAICYVMQETILFDRTLKENLALGNPNATEKEMLQAIETAELRPLLDRLPHDWDTPLGPRGNSLSGGERQRIALARAVLQTPSVLILDESTSALDSPTERRVLANIGRRFQGHTMIVISHRLASVTWVDRIIVLDGGRVADEGTHEQLLRRGGLYCNLYNAPVSDGPSVPQSNASATLIS